MRLRPAIWVFAAFAAAFAMAAVAIVSRTGDTDMPTLAAAPTHPDFEGVGLVAVREGSGAPAQVEYATFAAG
jgi:hypothetical protein